MLLLMFFQRFQSLKNFYIDEVIGLYPLILYASLLFFAIGLIDLLWHLNKGIVIYVSVLCGIVVVFHVTTTMIPFFTTRTPFRTPLSDFLANF
ncbi:hypothetical protein BDQ17DRAFT_589403 [Cyathus striatus]|nr:hypothetical protein BDQ17DRAFT_589403 [Cyathus striatus]